MTELYKQSCFIEELKRKIRVNKEDILFVCIGTNEIVADSIGPRIGSFLKKSLGKKMVLGDMNKPFNSRKQIFLNYFKLKNKFVIAIDTAISETFTIGSVFISENPIIMGLGISKFKGCIGNIGIKIVIPDLKVNNQILINKISNQVGDGIIKSLY